MKINEIVAEGIIGSAIKGLAKGIGGVLAPQSTEYLSKTKLAKPLPAAGTDGDQPTSKQADVMPIKVPGFEIVNPDPIMVKYRNADYAINDQGEWYKMGTRGTKAPIVKDVDPTLEKMLDKVAGFRG